MLKIDLSRRRVERVRKVEKYRLITRLVAIVALGVFMAQVLYLTGRLLWGRVQYDNLKLRADALTDDLTKRASEIGDYFEVKESLKTLEKLDNSRFKYREYLDYIDSLLPAGVSLSSVDFAAKNVIVFGLKFPSIDSYVQFEASVKDKAISDSMPIFGLTQESLSRLEDGTYLVKMILKIKNG
jgi:hypothetical protein